MERGAATAELSEANGLQYAPVSAGAVGYLDSLACDLCGSGEDDASMLLCDGCDKGFHVYCLDPPLASVDDAPDCDTSDCEGCDDCAWYCKGCAPAPVVGGAGAPLAGRERCGFCVRGHHGKCGEPECNPKCERKGQGRSSSADGRGRQGQGKASGKTCRQCDKQAVVGNYGFCDDHRNDSNSCYSRGGAGAGAAHGGGGAPLLRQPHPAYAAASASSNGAQYAHSAPSSSSAAAAGAAAAGRGGGGLRGPSAQWLLDGSGSESSDGDDSDEEAQREGGGAEGAAAAAAAATRAAGGEVGQEGLVSCRVWKGWNAALDASGKSYFWHTETRKTTWDDPRDAVAWAAAAAAAGAPRRTEGDRAERRRAKQWRRKRYKLEQFVAVPQGKIAAKHDFISHLPLTATSSKASAAALTPPLFGMGQVTHSSAMLGEHRKRKAQQNSTVQKGRGGRWGSSRSPGMSAGRGR